MAFRNPITSLPAGALIGQITGEQLAPGALDNKIITGSTFRTSAAGPRVEITPYGAGTGAERAVVDLYSGASTESAQAQIMAGATGTNPTDEVYLQLFGPSKKGPTPGTAYTRAKLYLFSGDADTVAQVILDGKPPYQGAWLAVREDGTVLLNGKLNVTSDATVSGDATVSSNLFVSGRATVSGTLRAQNILSGTFDVPALAAGTTTSVTVGWGPAMAAVPAVVGSVGSYRYTVNATGITTSSARLLIANYTSAAGAATTGTWLAVAS